LTVQLECKTSGSVCCDNFATAWAEEVTDNYPNLINVDSCVYNNGLVTVVFDQYGSNFFTSDQILVSYWNAGGCKNQNPLDGTVCQVNSKSLTTTIWSTKSMVVDSVLGTPSPLPYYYYVAPKPSTSSVLSAATSILIVIATTLLLL